MDPGFRIFCAIDAAAEEGINVPDMDDGVKIPEDHYAIIAMIV